MRKRQHEEMLRVRKLPDLCPRTVSAIAPSRHLFEAEMMSSEFALEVDAEDPIFDSGASRHLIAQKYVKDFPDYVHASDQAITLSTASGSVDCSSDFCYLNHQADECVVALILPDTPTVLSMGIFVIDMG